MLRNNFFFLLLFFQIKNTVLQYYFYSISTLNYSIRETIHFYACKRIESEKENERECKEYKLERNGKTVALLSLIFQYIQSFIRNVWSGFIFLLFHHINKRGQMESSKFYCIHICKRNTKKRYTHSLTHMHNTSIYTIEYIEQWVLCNFWI